MTKFKTSKIILTLFIVLAFFLAQNALLLSFANKSFSNLPVFADSQGTHVGTLSLITNSTFNTTSSGSTTNTSSYYTGSSSIKTPSSWTKDLSTPYPTSLKMGVVDLSDNSKYNDYGLNTVGKTVIYTDSKNAESEHNALMINSETERSYGFTSSSFELQSSSFYSITVSYFTQNNAVASVFIKKSDELIQSANASFVDLNTNQTWQTVTFWIATSTTEKLSSLKLYLCLGVPATSYHSLSDCSGFVLFDNIIVKQYSKMAFTTNSEVVTSIPTQNKMIDLNHEYVTAGDAGYVQNGDFELGISNWTVDNNKTTGSGFYTVTDLSTFEASDYHIDESFVPGTNYSAENNQKALLVTSTGKAGTIVVKSDAFTIKAQQIYRLSVWAKGKISKGELKITLAGTNPNAIQDDEESHLLSKTFTALSTTSNTYTNGWVEYVFYVTGNPLYDCEDVYLALGLSDATGYVLFDDIKTQVISSADKTSGTGVDSNTLSLDLFSETSHTVTNSNFNTFAETDKEPSFPKSPASWEKIDSSTSTADVSGIVNTKTAYYDTYKSNFGNPVNPGLPSSIDSILDESNNVLMMYNVYSAASYQKYKTSSTVSLSANTYYILSVDVCTLSEISGLGGISIEITNSSDVVLQKIENIRTDGQWKVAKIYIHTGDASQTATISLSFGSQAKTVRGWAFFDNCEIESSDEDAFNAATQSSLIAVSNISADATTVYSPTETTSNSLYTPLYYQSDVVEYTEPESSVAGILTQNNQYKFFNNHDYNINASSDSVLVIKADYDVYQTVTAKFAYSFEASNYYKVTVDVKTVGVSQQIVNQKYDVNGNLIPYGASISISGFDQKFTGINTAPKDSTIENPFLDDNNVFVTYTFYINPTETVEGNLILSLGTTDGLTSGYVFFDNVSITKIDEDVYKNETSTFEDEGIPETVISIVNNTASDDDDQKDNFGSAFDWYAIPTVIIAIAVVITVIGFIIRKHNKNKTEKVSVKVSYDRSDTLLKDMDSRHRKSAINHRLKLLYEELEVTEEALRKEKEEHKKQSDAYQTAKEIAEQDPSVSIEEPDSKFNNYAETVEQLENNIEAIKADIKGLEMEKQKYIEKDKERIEKNTNNTVTTKKVQRKNHK